MKVYLVGGAVRDELLGRPVADLDFVVTGSTPAELLAAGYSQIGKDFPTFLHPETKHEYALARTERKAGSGHTGFICDFGPELTLEEDLERRDLTINAMAKGDDGELVDPYGGIEDLRAKVFRHVSDAFREDPLRILRVARFAARLPEFSLASETLRLMTIMTASGELEGLSAERVWKETARALTETSPSRYFGILKACGALDRLFPELSNLCFDYELQALSEKDFQTGLQLDMAASANETADVVFGVCTARLDPDAAAGLAARLKAPALTQLLVRRVAQEFESVDVLAGALLAWINRRSVGLIQDLGADCLHLIEACDGFRRPAVFRDCVKACLYALWKSESPLGTKAGGGGCVNLCTIVRIRQSYFSAVEQTFLACQQTAAAVEAGSLVQKGYRGEAVGIKLRELRLAAVVRYLAKSSLDHKQEN